MKRFYAVLLGVSAALSSPAWGSGLSDLLASVPPSVLQIGASYCAGEGQRWCLEMWDRARADVISRQRSACNRDETCMRQLAVDVAKAESEASWPAGSPARSMMAKTAAPAFTDTSNVTWVQGWWRLYTYYSVADYQGDTLGWSRIGVGRPSWCAIFDIWVLKQIYGDSAVPDWKNGSGITNRTRAFTTSDGVNHPADFVALGKNFTQVKPGDICHYTCAPANQARCNETKSVTVGGKVVTSYPYHIDHHALVASVNPDGSFDMVNGNGDSGSVSLSHVASPSTVYDGCYSYMNWSQ